MPDANGNFRGIGWSRRSDDAWDRVFGQPDTEEADAACRAWCDVPREPPHENPDEMADRAEAAGWGR